MTNCDDLSYMSYEAYQSSYVVGDLKRRQEHTGVKATHRRVIHTLEAMRLPVVAAWYWKDQAITSEADLDREVP